MESCEIIGTLRFALQNDDKNDILRIETFCKEKIESAVEKCSDRSGFSLESDAFSTATITEGIKNVVLGETASSNERVIAAR